MDELSEKDQLLIDKYLLGQLSLEDQKEFDIRMSNDLFAQEVASMKSAQLVLKKKGEEKFRAEFNQIDMEMDKNLAISRQSRTMHYSKWIIGIALLALLVYLFSRLLNPDKEQYDVLFAEYYQPMPNMVAPIEKNTSNASTYELAFQNYERGNYQDAIRFFENLDEQTDAAVFYHGLSLLGLDRANEAIPFLDRISSFSDSEFTDAAQWYLMLAHIHSENVEMTSNIGERILNKAGHKYRSEAEELMLKIK